MTAEEGCPDCGVKPGERHEEGCDVARCVVCGAQQLQCDPEEEHGLTGDYMPPMQTWTGEWPGDAECREWGWFGRFTVMGPHGPTGSFVPCGPDAPGAMTDVAHLLIAEARGEIRWSREHERYVRLDEEMKGVAG